MVTVKADADSQNGSLRAKAAGGAIVIDSGQSTLVVQGTEADINATLATLTYTVPHPDFNKLRNAGNVIVKVDVYDLGNTGLVLNPLSDLDNHSLAVTIEAINDRPTIDDSAIATTTTTITTPAPGLLTLEEDIPSGMSITGIVVGDVDYIVGDPTRQDNANTELRVTLTVLHGGLTINLAGTLAVIVAADSHLVGFSGLSPDPAHAGAATTYEVLSVQGTIADLNTVLMTLTYFNDFHFNTEISPANDERLVVEVNDLGYTDKASGTVFDVNNPERLLASVTHAVTVLPTNDAPTIDTSAGTLSQVNLTVPEDAPAGLSIVGIQVFENPDDLYDPDDVIVNVTLSVVHGGLKLTTGGATGVSVVGALSTLATLDGTAPGVAAAVGAYQSVTIQGTIAKLNNQPKYVAVLQRRELQHGDSAAERRDVDDRCQRSG